MLVELQWVAAKWVEPERVGGIEWAGTGEEWLMTSQGWGEIEVVEKRTEGEVSKHRQVQRHLHPVQPGKAPQAPWSSNHSSL